MQAMRSNNKVLDALMRQKIEGKIPGVLGRLVRFEFNALNAKKLNIFGYLG